MSTQYPSLASLSAPAPAPNSGYPALDDLRPGSPPLQPTPKSGGSPASSSGGSSGYDHAGLRELWTKNGGDPHVADLMAHVAQAESAGHPGSEGSYTDGGHRYMVQGLWQISTIHGKGNWFDPTTNVKKAIELYNAQGMSPWEDSRNKGGREAGAKASGWGQYAGQDFARGAGETIPQKGKPHPKSSHPYPTLQELSKLTPPKHIEPVAPVKVADTRDPLWNAIPSGNQTPLEPDASKLETAGLQIPYSNTAVQPNQRSAPPKGSPSYHIPGNLPAPVTIAENAFNAANHLWVEEERRRTASMKHPIQAFQELEQTPARFVATMIQHGVSRQTFASAIHNALTPGEGDSDAANLVSRIVGAIHPYDPLTTMLKPPPFEASLEKATGTQAALDTFRKNFQNFAEQFSAATIADPVSYIPVLGVLKETATGMKIMEMIAGGAKAVGGTRVAAPLLRAHRLLSGKYGETLKPLVDHLLKARPELDKYLDPHAKAARMGFEGAEEERIRTELGSGDAQLLHDNKAVLESGEIPDAVRQRYLREAYNYGSPRMRSQALGFGYRPQPMDFEKPEGVLNYELAKDYQYAGKIGSGMDKSPLFEMIGPKKVLEDATFEHERTPGNNWDDNNYERTRVRLAMGRRAIWERRANASTTDYLQTHGGWKMGGPKTIDPTLLSTNPTRFRGLNIIGRLGTQAVQGVPFPHALNNVGTLTFLKSPLGVGRAVGYMAKGVSEDQLTRIKNMGSYASYTHDPGAVWSKIPVSKQLLAGGQAVLTKMETAYRQGLLDELDKKLGPSYENGHVTNLPLEMQKGQEIRDAVVDYRNVPLVISVMSAMGAPFAPFFGGLVKAVGHAIIHHPERVAAVNRAEREVQDNFGVTVPNPVNTFATLMFDMPHELASRMGPVGTFFSRASESDDPQRLDSWMAHMLQAAGGPWLSRAPEFFNQPYPDYHLKPETLTPVQGLQALGFGGYPYHPPSKRKPSRFERRKEAEQDENINFQP